MYAIRSYYDMKIKRLVLLVFILSTTLAILQWHRFEEAIFTLQGHPFGAFHLSMGRFLMCISLAVFAWRLFLFLKYRPTRALTDEEP